MCRATHEAVQMSTLFIIFLFAAGAAVVLVSVILLVALVRSQRLAKAPPPPPFKCPACGSEQINVFSSGLWDGEDGAGRGTGGSHEIGTCSSCGVHCRHVSFWDNDKKERRYEISVLADQEWQRETGPREKWRRQAKSWPFESKDENHVA
jgi:hypothetical protein